MTDPVSRLHRGLGVPGAVVVGISAMLGTGVFAVWTPAWEWAGGLLLVSLLLAALVAGVNAVATARLARVHPESGGAYAYGRLRLGRAAGVTAGLAFLLGKSASAAAAALTIGAYVWPGHERWIAWAALALALLIDLRGIVRSTRVNAVLIAVLLVIITLAVVAGATNLPSIGEAVFVPPLSAVAVVGAAGLLFVAFAGYARITVLGEEVRDPRRTIPVAMSISFVIVLVVYVVVAVVVSSAGSAGVPLSAAPLEDLAGLAESPALRTLVVIGAVIGAGSVLINLIAGMGRTLFAMASQGDAPRGLAAVSAAKVPHRAALAVTVAAAVLVIPGRLAWALALSGGSILVYYSVAHLASWRLPGPWLTQRALPVLGLILCVGVIAALLVTAAMSSAVR